jgi:hypothetical protein
LGSRAAIPREDSDHAGFAYVADDDIACGGQNACGSTGKNGSCFFGHDPNFTGT